MLQTRTVPWLTVFIIALCSLGVGACHRQVAMPPLQERNIATTDHFFDVWPTSADRAFMVGGRGKVLLTEDAGRTFKRVDIHTDVGVYGIQMVDAETGYLCGQDGLLMRTRDGGKTWEKLNSRTNLRILAMSFPDRLHGYLVGNNSLVLSTENGGETFFKRQLERQFPPELKDFALPFEDPSYYGVSFPDKDHGWVTGEFGRIWATGNGGRSWVEQQGSLAKQWKAPPSPNNDPRLLDFLLPEFFGISFRDANHGAAAGLVGWVVYTVDGGKNWWFGHQADKPGGPPDNWIPGGDEYRAREPLFSINLFGKREGIAAGFSGVVLRLQPNGTWARDENGIPPVPLSQVRFFDETHGWIVGMYGTVLYTEDGGKTWRACQG
jgi:photosystem II stability/assembly factor-like uncharacterized protein